MTEIRQIKRGVEVIVNNVRVAKVTATKPRNNIYILRGTVGMVREALTALKKYKGENYV